MIKQLSARDCGAYQMHEFTKREYPDIYENLVEDINAANTFAALKAAGAPANDLREIEAYIHGYIYGVTLRTPAESFVRDFVKQAYTAIIHFYRSV